MISIENPPSDPSSCSCSDQFPQLKNSSCSSNSCSKSSSSSSDEKKITSAASASDNKLALVEEEVDPFKSGLDENNPNPKFSIRDYVFGSRSKDISKNWPFSQENLQLCLKHGVKNLLPPFHPLDSVRNPSFGGCTIDEINVSSRDGESSKQTDQIISATADSAKCNPELALDFRNSNNNNCLELVADLFVEGSNQRSKVEIPPTSRKSDTTIQTTGKKCKLVVKFGPVVDPVSTSEDITVNNFMVSEAMSSKVCPVCKTFSSSSNTTLNAHIDQCLSGESTMKWTANPKVIKNRIKPRKTRLMVDIYKTASYCTLEELDRRNGTNWATNSSFPAQEIEFHGELKEKEQRLNTEYVETGHEGDVYIDTDGTKIRILSAPKIGVEGEDGARKLVKGKVSTNLTSKKRKKSLEEKHLKFLKLSPHRKKFCSPKSRHGFEMQSNQEKKFSNGEDCENVDKQKWFQAQGERELDDTGTIKSWGCSRRSSHAKRAHGKCSTRFTETRISPVEKNQSSLERRCVLRTRSSSYSPISSPESSKQMDTSPYEPPVVEYGKHPLLRKRMAFQSGSSARNKAGSSTNNDVFVSSPKSRRFSSLKKNLLSVSRESTSNLKRKFPAHKTTQKHMERSQENCLLKPLQDPSRHQSVTEDVTGKTALGSLHVLKLKKKRVGIYSFKNEESLALKSVQLPARKNLDSSRQFTSADTLGDGDSSQKESESHGEQLGNVGRNFSNPALDSESESQQFVGVHQGSFFEAEEPLPSPEPSLDGKDEIFLEDHTHKTIVGHNIGISAESDSKELGQGGYFAEVDPIPIPGPPGSFLPSPGGDIVSEDLQGNSSLTNSRVQSSDDHLDLLDRDSSSDSPISATSNISNPTLTRSDSRSSEKFSVRSAVVEENFSPVQQATSVVAERTSNLNDWRQVNEIFSQKGLPPSSKNDQPCCCSRKEGPPQASASAYHESALLRRRGMESNKRSSINSNNFKSEEFSVSNHPTSVPEKVVLPEVKFPVRDDCVAASPSSSNPVLRLMGKDLMVVKKDEDVSPQLRPPPASAMVDRPNRQFQMVKAASSGNLPYDQDYHSLRQVFPIFGRSHNEPELQHIDFSTRLPNDFSNHVQLKAAQIPIHATFPSTTVLAGGYMTSAGRCNPGGCHPSPTPLGRPRDYNLVRSENNIECRLPTDQQTRSNSGYGTPLACGRNAFSISNNPTKEVIIIDDSPENEADLPSDHAMQCEGIMRSDPVSSPIPSHFHSVYNPRHVNSFYDYPLRGSFPYGGSPVFEDARFQNPVSREVKSSPAQWNPNSVAASLPPAFV